MKLKKILSLTMALAMAFALAIPALADTVVEDSTSTTISSTATPTTGSIKVTIPAANAIVLNPYSMKVTANGKDNYHQVIHPAVFCKNESQFPLKVNATVTGDTSNGQAALVSTLPKDTTTTKDVFLYVEFGVTESNTVQPTWATEYNKSNTNQLLVTPTPAQGAAAPAAKTVMTLSPGNVTNNYLWYKFDGVVAKSPATAWAAADTVVAALALTFLPTIDTVYNVNLTNTVSKTADGTATLNLDLAPAGVSIVVTTTVGSLGGTPTVTATQGTTKLTVTDNEDGTYTFKMPAGDVDVTVKWVASS
jgi:hypothetical protein